MTRSAPDLILHRGLFTSLDRANPTADAQTRVIDAHGRRVPPGLIDNHLHLIRGGLNFNLELGWDGVRSLADAMDTLRRLVACSDACWPETSSRTRSTRSQPLPVRLDMSPTARSAGPSVESWGVHRRSTPVREAGLLETGRSGSPRFGSMPCRTESAAHGVVRDALHAEGLLK